MVVFTCSGEGEEGWRAAECGNRAAERLCVKSSAFKSVVVAIMKVAFVSFVSAILADDGWVVK